MNRRITGRARQQRNNRILATTDTCWICGHPGADAIDHKTALANGGTEHPTNLAPAHHDTPCPTCDTKCNRVKSDRAIAPTIRRSTSLTRPD